MNMETNIPAFFGQATQNMEATMQASARLQKEAARWWSDMIQNAATVLRIQRRAQRVMSEFLPGAQQNAGQYFTMMANQYRRTIELTRSWMEASRSRSISEIQSRMMEVWEASLGAWRTGSRELTQINNTMADRFVEMADRTSVLGTQAIHAMQTTQRAGSEATARAAEAIGGKGSRTASGMRPAMRQETRTQSRPAAPKRRTAASRQHTARAAHAPRKKK